MDSQEIVSRTVRVYMAARDETHEELAAELAMARSTLTTKLAGRSRWTLADLERLRGHYGLTPEELLTGQLLEALGADMAKDRGGPGMRTGAPRVRRHNRAS